VNPTDADLDDVLARVQTACPALLGSVEPVLDELRARRVEAADSARRLEAVQRMRAETLAELNALRGSLRPLPEECPLDLAAIEGRVSDPNLTEGPWSAYLDGDAGRPCVECPARADGAKFLVAEVCSESSADAAFLEHARTDVPDLLRELRRFIDLFARERGVRRSYEEAITWETSCLSCAPLLTTCRAAEERAERAEAELRARPPVQVWTDEHSRALAPTLDPLRLRFDRAETLVVKWVEGGKTSINVWWVLRDDYPRDGNDAYEGSTYGTGATFEAAHADLLRRIDKAMNVHRERLAVDARHREMVGATLVCVSRIIAQPGTARASVKRGDRATVVEYKPGALVLDVEGIGRIACWRWEVELYWQVVPVDERPADAAGNHPIGTNDESDVNVVSSSPVNSGR
jgi:hypothetical protein